MDRQPPARRLTAVSDSWPPAGSIARAETVPHGRVRTVSWPVVPRSVMVAHAHLLELRHEVGMLAARIDSAIAVLEDES
jgi:hypothetical protein